MPTKSSLLERLELGEGGLAPGLVVGQDHLAHGDDPLLAEEHVLGAAQADPLGAELAGLGGSPSGVSALVRTLRVRTLSAHFISVKYSSGMIGSTSASRRPRPRRSRRRS